MSTTATPASTPNSAGKAAWVCLAIAWICFLLPIPGLGLFIGWPLNLVAFILAIVAMSKRGAMGGLFQLLASLIASPVVYLIGLAIFGGSIGALSKAAQEAEAEKKARAASSISAPASEPAADAAKREPIVIDAKALGAEYLTTDGEFAADKRYADQPMRVTGKIHGKPIVMQDRTALSLEGSPEDKSITGRGRTVYVFGLTAEDGKGLKEGQQITVDCASGGSIQHVPALNKCRISN